MFFFAPWNLLLSADVSDPSNGSKDLEMDRKRQVGDSDEGKTFILKYRVKFGNID